MTPTDPTPKPVSTRRPGGGGGATYRHPSDHSYHDGVHDHALDDELHNPEVAHEHSDVNVRAIIMSGVILVVVSLVSHLIIAFLFGWFEQDAAASQPPASPLARPATEMPAATRGSASFNERAQIEGPQLLTNEPMALQRQLAEEEKKLHVGGWIDQNAGVAHIPIAEAKKLIVERGLPVRADGAVEPTLGTRLPAAGEASGGRIITVPLPEAPAAAPAAPEPTTKGH